MTTRREFLKATAGTTAIVGAASCLPQMLLKFASGKEKSTAANDNILVVIQLSGGNDGLNTVIPYRDPEYYRNRLTLGLDRNRVLKINDELGLHPSMEGCSKLIEESKLCVVQGVGYEKPNRSHFESMDLWHTAHQSPEKTIKQGWLGRAMDQAKIAGNIPAVHFGSEVQPLALASPKIQSPSIRSLETFKFEASSNNHLKNLMRSLRGHSTGYSSDQRDNDLLGFVASTSESAWKTSEQVESILGKRLQEAKYPSFNLAQKLQNVSRLIRAELQTSVYYVTLDGFDTHSKQAESHAGLLSELSQSLSAFIADLEDQGNLDRVTVLTFSEFGRRVKENASQGTDHGAAAPVLIAGGGLKKTLVGKNPDLTDLQDGDLKHDIDYRQIYAALLQKLGLQPDSILGGDYKPLDLFV